MALWHAVRGMAIHCLRNKYPFGIPPERTVACVYELGHVMSEICLLAEIKKWKRTIALVQTSEASKKRS